MEGAVEIKRQALCLVLQELPTAPATAIDIKAVRLVCREWRDCIDATIVRLKPRNLYKVPSIPATFPAVTSLDCTLHAGPSAQVIESVAALNNLRSLYISGNYTTGNRVLDLVAGGLPQLTLLKCTDFKAVTDNGVQHLSRLQDLQWLSMPGADGVTGTGLTVLIGLKKLQALDLSSCIGLDDFGLEVIEDLTRLTRLHLRNLIKEWSQPMLQRIVASLRLLEHLQIGCEMEAPTIRAMSHLTNLRHLDLGLCEGMDGTVLHHLLPLTQLTFLGLQATGPYTRRELAALSVLRALRSLSLVGVEDLFNDCLEGLASLGLTHLDLRDCTAVYNPSLQHVGTLRDLRELHLTAQITARGLFMLTGISRLSSLTVSRCERLTPRSGVAISKLRGLAHLDLSCSDVTDDMLADMRGLRNLQRLVLFNCSMVSDTAVHRGLTALTALTELNVAGTQVGNEAVYALRNLPSLQVLHLEATPLCDEGMIHRLTALRKLKELYLVGGHISDRGLAALSCMTTLQGLRLGRSDRITDRGISIAIPPLMRHSLSWLWLTNLPCVTAGVLPLLGTTHHSVNGFHRLLANESSARGLF